MSVNIREAYNRRMYLVSDNGIIRTEPNEEGRNFTAYRKTSRGGFELEPENGKLNKEIAMAFRNALTLEITKGEYYNKSMSELLAKYRKENYHRI